MTFTIGADPELFLKENGKAISAFGMLRAQKNPRSRQTAVRTK